MVELLWLIPALPLAGFLVLLFLGKRIGEPVAGWLGTAMVGLSFVVALVVFAGLWNQPEHTYELSLFTWIPAGSFQVDIGFLLDPLSMAMVLFVTGIAALIHLYSIGYMHGDSRFPRFFTYLNLFVFSMLMLVLGDNLVLTFLGWEGVGACSYFLISFWFEKDENASAGKKAFITNRVGDWGFMVGTFVVFFALGTVKYTEFLPLAPGIAATTATFIAFMLFIGAMGKSAQIPLFIWLPDAMAGPTPVSALIHAATMVTAGVYLMVRINPILAASASWLPWTIAIIGCATAFIAATIAIAQQDIKKVLAYSTVSQLGFMFLAVGVGGYSAAIFHMITHAFFKALMFLGAGSVIHGMHEEQDMRRMGALRKLMPVTAITFLVGWLAISGVPPFSGFWSKDDILAYALHKSPVLYVFGLITALMTAFYMSRLVFRVFYGDARWGESADAELANLDAHDQSATVDHDELDAAHAIHPHESPRTMLIPLVVLAFFSAIAGVMNLPFTEKLEFLDHWLEPVVGANQAVLHLGGGQLAFELITSTIVALTGIGLAYYVYLKKRIDARRIELPFFANGWYIDQGITAFMGGIGRKAFEMIALFDSVVIDGAVNGVGRATRGGAVRLRNVQNGYVRWYALMIGVGAVVIMAFVLTQVNF
ncbi:NuoL NADH,ubiquinone oxidoreductase subunit 5 (chain L)/Multisubunit Na+/H+ antiporter, MnhA subunit [Acidimicrobiia bacterium]